MLRNLIKRFGNRERRDWQVLLLSLLLAFFIWLIYNLSGEYSAFLEYDLVARSDIRGHSDRPVSSATLIIRGKTNGFNIIRRRLYKSVPIEIEVSPSLWKQSADDDELYYLTEDAMRELMPSVGLSNVELEYFVTSRLEFRFPKEEYKKVPVIPNAMVTCRPQYMQVGEVVVEPDSVLVYGTSQQLSAIEYVNTEAIYAEDIMANKEGVSSLMSPRGLRLSDKMVHYIINVSRYVELREEVDLTVKNLPAGENSILLPSRSTIVYRVPFPSHSIGEADFSAGIDYNDMSRMSGFEMPVRLFSAPDGILSYRFEPPVVDFIEHE